MTLFLAFAGWLGVHPRKLGSGLAAHVAQIGHERSHRDAFKKVTAALLLAHESACQREAAEVSAVEPLRLTASGGPRAACLRSMVPPNGGAPPPGPHPARPLPVLACSPPCCPCHGCPNETKNKDKDDKGSKDHTDNKDNNRDERQSWACC